MHSVYVRSAAAGVLSRRNERKEYVKEGVFIRSDDGVSAICPVAMDMVSATGR